MPANNTRDVTGLGKIVKFKVAPEHIRDYLKRLGPNRKKNEYRGGHAQIAHPGIVIPRLWGDAKVDCFLLWASEIYDDANGRKRIDVGFGVCMGEADVNRIEYGDDHIPMFDAASLEGNIVTEKYFRKVELFRGTDDQSYSTVIAKHLDPDDIPRYPGLCCFFIRGLKLWKFPEKAVPHIRTVGVRNLEPSDVYEEEFFPSTSAVSGLKSVIGYDNKIFGIGNLNVAGYLDLTDGSWNVIDGIGFIVPFQNGLAIMNGNLYGVSSTGLYEYNNDTTWTQKASYNGRCIASNLLQDLLLIGSASGTNEMRTYDGTTEDGLGNLLNGANPVACRIIEATNPYKSASSLGATRHVWEYILSCDVTTSWCSVLSTSTNILNFIYVGLGDQNGWLTSTQTGGASATLSVISFPAGVNYTDTINVIGSPLSCYALNYFAEKTHIGVANTGTDGGYIYRLDEDTGTFTKLPRATGVPTDTSVSVAGTCVFEQNLYVASNKGIWKQGDA